MRRMNAATTVAYETADKRAFHTDGALNPNRFGLDRFRKPSTLVAELLRLLQGVQEQFLKRVSQLLTREASQHRRWRQINIYPQRLLGVGSGPDCFVDKLTEVKC